jgi:hypothetical protein
VNLANVAFLLGALVISVVGSLALWLYHRRPQSFTTSIDDFQREMTALGHDQGSGRRSGRRSGRGRGRQRPEPIVPPRPSGTPGELGSAAKRAGRVSKGA